MTIKIYSTYEELSVNVADYVIKLMSGYDKPLFCPASGDTPAGVYRTLIERFRDKKYDVADWKFVGLDEWVGLNGTDEGSCRHSIDKDLFLPLGIREDNIFFFDGRSVDLPKSCRDAEQFISDQNGIDVVILGLGMNGHIAMNEPGCTIDCRTQIVPLHPVTGQVGQKYFNEPKILKEGITLGMGTLLESTHVILMVSGEHKAEIVRKMIEEPVTRDLPGSLLLSHPSLTIFLDGGAAAHLSNKN